MIQNKKKKLKEFPLKSRTRKGRTLFLLLFNMMLEILARLIRKEMAVTVIWIEKEVKIPYLKMWFLI